jgi:hypothetical protein
MKKLGSSENQISIDPRGRICVDEAPLPMIKASSPCMHCKVPIEVELIDRFDMERAMTAAGAVWDRGWFCSGDCRDAFNAYAPKNGWDRIGELFKERGES